MKKLFTLALLAIATLAVAQEKRFVIRGEMSSTKFCYSDDTVSMVTLEQLVDGQPVAVATSPVKFNTCTFKLRQGLYEIS